MKTIPVAILSILVTSLFISCNHNKASATIQSKKDSPKKIQKKSPVLATRTVIHAFSEKNQKDTFRLTVTGASILTGKICFEIISYKSKKIYTQTFDAASLLNYDIAPTAPDREKQQFIKQRIKDFFNEDNFMNPAIKSEDTFDTDYSSGRKEWEAIKADRSAIGFYYLVGEEDGRSIAWSKTLKKVVLYFNCC